MRKFLVSSAAALAILAFGSVSQAKAEPVAITVGLYTVYAVLTGGAACGLENQLVGDNFCKGRDNTDWASSFYKTTVPVSGYKVAAADMSKITPAPAFAAVSTNLGDMRRAELIAAFDKPAYDLYASVQ